MIDEEPRGGAPIPNSAVLFQHGDARTANGLGASPNIDPALLEGQLLLPFLYRILEEQMACFKGEIRITMMFW